MTKIPKFIIKKRYIFCLAIGLVAIILDLVCAMQPAWCESWYARGFYPALLPVWSYLPGLLPVPLWEIEAGLLVVGALFLFGRGVVRLIRIYPNYSIRRFFSRLGGLALSAACLASVMAAVFLFSWGLNYQRQSWAQNQQWSAPGGTSQQIAALARRLATQISRDRALLPEGPAGTIQPKEGSWTDQSMLDQVNAAWNVAALRDPLLIPYSPGVKPAIMADLFSRFFVAGIFMPFTAEAVVNPGPADFSVPFAAAHEIAHQRGWAREDEANFLAFLVLEPSPNAGLRYAAAATAFLYLDSLAFDQLDPSIRREIMALLPPGFRRDVQANGSYWQGFRGLLSDLGTAMNDGYLKSQGQAAGVRSYGRMVDLLLAWSLL